MRYRLTCSSTSSVNNILNRYPILNNYDPIVDYPYPNLRLSRLTIEVEDLINFYNDIEEYIIISHDFFGGDKSYSLEIYDGCREEIY